MGLVTKIKSISSQRQIIKSMVIKNLKDKYMGSMLGFSWAILNPLLLMLVITFVFSQVLKTETRNFPMFTLSALLPWFFFSSSISEATGSMRGNVNILSQFILAREIIPLSIVLANLINFLFGFAVMLPIFIFFNSAILKVILFLPLVIFLHFLFTLGISLLFSVTNVYFKDLSQLLNIGLMFLFWVTPVFYPFEMVPAGYRSILLFNPAVCYTEIYRSLLYYGSGGPIQMWLLASGFALISLIIGWFVFSSKEAEILKYI